MTTSGIEIQEKVAGFQRAREECRMGKPRLFMESYLQLRDSSGALIPMEFRANQEYFYRESFEKLEDYYSGMRLVVVKHRDALSTTFWHLAGVACMLCIPGFICASIIDTESKHKEVILPMIDNAFNNLPSWMTWERGQWDTEMRVVMHRDADGRSLGSIMTFSSARTKNFARGGRPKMVIQSEKAHYEPTLEQDLNIGIEGAATEETWLVEESTPKGVGNSFYVHYQAISSGEAPGRVLTRYWFDDPKNRLEPGIDELRPADQREWDATGRIELSEEEKEEAQRFPQDGAPAPERVLWHRKKEQAAVLACLGSESNGRALMEQEYPSNDVDCWYVVANPSLPRERLRSLERECQPPLEEGLLAPGIVKQVWERATPAMSYVIGVDPARGIAGGDLLSAQVIEMRGGAHVAQFYGIANLTMFIKAICGVAREYNEALLGIEATGNGWAAIEAARLTGYGNLYYRKIERTGAMRLPTLAHGEARRLGWETNGKTLPLMHEALWTGLFDGSLSTRSRVLIRDLLAYNPNEEREPGDLSIGSRPGLRKMHIPDRVAAFMIAAAIRKERGLVVSAVGGRWGIGPRVIVPVPYL